MQNKSDGLHAFDFYVAETASEAKQQALASLLVGKDQQHKDNLKDVDNCKLLSQIGVITFIWNHKQTVSLSVLSGKGISRLGYEFPRLPI